MSSSSRSSNSAFALTILYRLSKKLSDSKTILAPFALCALTYMTSTCDVVVAVGCRSLIILSTDERH